jgi:hypothetical protein
LTRIVTLPPTSMRPGSAGSIFPLPNTVSTYVP